MTGLDRLREFAAGISPITAVCGVTKTAYDMEHMEVVGARLRDFLADIADQIEAEQEERITRRLEDREAAEWVRERGGLSHVKDICHDFRAVVERLGIEWSESELHGLMDALDRRLMPEGMEWLLEVWPKWSNGEYCKFGDWWTAYKYGDYEPRQLRRLIFYTPEQLREWEQDEGDNFGYEWDFMRPSDTTYRPDKAEPPAPKVPDADGAEIRAGEMLFHVMSGDGVTARQLMPPDKFEDTEFIRHFASEYTHRAPVRAADGKPLHDGETVWHIKTGREYVVVEPSYGKTVVVRLAKYDDAEGEQHAPDKLTHERPDSWERLEADAGKNPFDYCKDVGHRLDTCENSEAYKARDLVRRCKELARKENNNE